MSNQEYTLSFETLEFKLEKNILVVVLLKQFKTKIPLKELPKFTLIDTHTLEFENGKAIVKFNFTLKNYFDNLTNMLTQNRVTYVHANSGIPLINKIIETSLENLLTRHYQNK